MDFFYNKTEKSNILSEKINKQIYKFIEYFRNDKDLQNYIKSFGIIGPSARGEGFFINEKIRSDIDLYVITNYISFCNAKKLNKLFDSFFDKKLDISLLYFSPKSFKKPDLMMYELTNTGLNLYGEKLDKISLYRISKIETIRNLVYRGFYFLDKFEVINGKIKLKDHISNMDFLYGFSKIVFALGEIFLILEGSYTASNFEREKNIKNNINSKNIKGFIELHSIMHDFRYNNIILEKFDIKLYSNKGFNLLLEGYKVIFKELFNCNNFDCKDFSKIKSNGISFFANRILYFTNSFIKYKKIKLFILKEPFIDLVERYILFLSYINCGKILKQDDLDELIEDWKIAPWIYYKI